LVIVSGGGCGDVDLYFWCCLLVVVVVLVLISGIAGVDLE